MYKPEREPKTHPHGPRKADCCADERCETGLRNQYFEGKRLTAESFRVEQRYQLERRRLLNRAIHGWGVVYGYGVTVVSPDARSGGRYPDRLQVLAGLSLDPCGRELLYLGGEHLALDDMLVFDGNGRGIARADRKAPESYPPPKREEAAAEPGRAAATSPRVLDALEGRPGGAIAIEPHEHALHADRVEHAAPGPERDPRRHSCWLLSVHYAERRVSPTTIHDPCSCERSEWDQVCETVRFSLRPVDCSDCCGTEPCELACDCSKSLCCRAHRLEAGQQPAEQGCRPVPRGGCACLCEHLAKLDPDPCRCALCDVDDPCAHVRVDLENGVPLACVFVVGDRCGNWTFAHAEPCGPRRLVKRNDLLFDLIRGCDLTRISRIGWWQWHRSRTPVRFPEFERSFGREDEKRGALVAGQYTIEFSRPVLADTVRADCFRMRFVLPDRGEGNEYRVPIVGVDLFHDGQPVAPDRIGAETVATSATLVFDAGWVRDAVRPGGWTLFRCEEVLVEIEALGDFMLDCNGQAVDVSAVGLCAFPTGSGKPGGTFHSRFVVEVPHDPRHGRGAAGVSSAQGA